MPAAPARIDADAIKRGVNLVDLISSYGVDLKKQGKTWLGLCPFHEDRHPSLYVDPVKGWICRSCGEHGDAISWVQKKDGMTFPEACRHLEGSQGAVNGKAYSVARKPVAEYDYADEDGNAVFQVVRFEPKGFSQRRALDGEWFWGLSAGWYVKGERDWKRDERATDPNSPPKEGARWLPAARIVPYHLPELLAAVKARKTIHVVEGEKDVEAIEAAGGAATCNPMGAGKWPDGFARYFANASQVVVARDKDEVGIKHAATVLASLKAAHLPAKVVEARVGKDAYDHLAAGHTLDNFVPVETGMRWVRAADIPPEPVAWLFERRLALGAFSLLQGDPGVGKSTIACALCAMVSSGKAPECWSLKHQAADAIYLSKEDSPKYTLVPRLMKLGADLARVHLPAPQENLDEAEALLQQEFVFNQLGLDELEAKIAETGAKLVIIDPLIAYLQANVDIHRQNETRAVMNQVIQIGERQGCAILGLLHMNKGASLKAMYRGIGSIDFPAIARTALMAGEDPDDHEARAVAQFKSNLGPWAKPLGYTILEEDGGELRWTGESELTGERMCEMPAQKKERVKGDACKEWLESWLAYGPSLATTCVEEGKAQQGHSKTLIYEAASALGVSKGSEPSDGTRGRRPVWWASRGYDWARHPWPQGSLPAAGPEEEKESEPYDPYADE